MFNWLKNKLNNVIPSDIKRGFMSSYFCSIKLGTKINIPENLVCFVCYKDKIYLELPAGEHILDNKNLKALCIKQHGTTNVKKVKLDLFFVNCAEFVRTIKFKNKISIANKLTRVSISSKFKLKINNVKLFNEIIQGEMSFVNAEKTDGVVEAYLEDVLRKFFLKVNLNSLNIQDEVKAQLIEKTKKACLNFGMELINLNIEISSLQINTETIKLNPSKIENTPKLIDQPKQNMYTNPQSEQKTTILNSNICPACKNKLISNSWYCHRCGYKIKK